MKINGYALSVANGASATLTFDLNGNMTSDGTNSYSWDAENRLLSIIYPGTGNHSDFSYDGLGRNVQILEYAASSLTSTKQFVWSFGNTPREARNAGGTITAQYFSRGETISGTSYFFTRTKERSVREMTNSSGTIEAQYAYDPFGQVTKISEAVPSDFGYAGYYLHARSGLNLTRTRAYSSSLARFINRDLVGEHGGINLYAYVENNPIRYSDPSGRQFYLPPVTPITAGIDLAEAVALAIAAAIAAANHPEDKKPCPKKKDPCEPPHADHNKIGPMRIDCEDWCDKNCEPEDVKQCKEKCKNPDLGYVGPSHFDNDPDSNDLYNDGYQTGGGYPKGTSLQ